MASKIKHTCGQMYKCDTYAKNRKSGSRQMLFFSSALYISCLALAAEQTVIYIKILRTGSQVKASLITIKNCPPIANILKCLLFKLPLQPIKVKSSQRMSKRAELNCKHTSIAYDSLCYRGMFSL